MTTKTPTDEPPTWNLDDSNSLPSDDSGPIDDIWKDWIELWNFTGLIFIY